VFYLQRIDFSAASTERPSTFKIMRELMGRWRALCFSSFSIASLIALKTDVLSDTKVTWAELLLHQWAELLLHQKINPSGYEKIQATWPKTV
jgi:hypothetical protein